MPNYIKWLLIAAVIAALISSLMVFDIDIQGIVGQLQDSAKNQPVKTAAAFFVLYVLVTSLSIPGAAILTLAAGAMFGVVYGSIIVSFASTIGATLAFLTARWLIGAQIQKKFGQQLELINQGIEKEGGYYLFTLRLVPLFPFFVINVLMGLTRIKTLTYYWVSQLGMLPATVIYVNAGAQTANIDQIGDLLSPSLILSFTLLGIFPLVAKKLMTYFKKTKTSA